MTTLLERAGASFLRAFGVTFLFLVVGILNAPDKNAAVALSIAALAAAIAAGIRAVQVFIPALSWSSLLPQPWAAWVDAFTRAFVGVFLSFWAGWFAAPEWATWKSALLAAVIGAATAGARALQGLTTPGESPASESGLNPPGA